MTALRGGCCGGPGDSPRIQCHVNKRKTNQRDRAKGFQRFPPFPLDLAGSPRPPARRCRGGAVHGRAAELPSAPIFGIAEPLALFSRRRGGREEARAKDSKVTSAVLVSHFLLCKVRRAGSMFPLVLKNTPEKCQ